MSVRLILAIDKNSDSLLEEKIHFESALINRNIDDYEGVKKFIIENKILNGNIELYLISDHKKSNHSEDLIDIMDSPRVAEIIFNLILKIIEINNDKSVVLLVDSGNFVEKECALYGNLRAIYKINFHFPETAMIAIGIEDLLRHMNKKVNS